MSIPFMYRANFETMMRAASDGRLALLECQDKATGQPCYVVTMVGDDPDSGDYVMVPVARMFDGDPYEVLNPPDPDGGFHE